MRKTSHVLRGFMSMMAMSMMVGSAVADLSSENLPLIDKDNGLKLEAEDAVVASCGKVMEDSTASGGKAVSPDGKSEDKQALFMEFKFVGKSRKIMEMYLRLKVEGSEKVRFYYELDKNPRFPLDLSTDGQWMQREVARTITYRTMPHSLRIYSNDPRLKIDSLHFENSATDTIPEARNLRTLPPPKNKRRVEVVDVNHVPANVGDAMICLWKNDAIGCATYTVDDNHAEEMAWWFEVAKKYNVRVTWFAIARNIGKGHPVGGKWEDFKRVLEKGHDVQSHSYSHLGDSTLTIDEEYSKGVETLEKNLPGHKILTIAYPGGRSMGKNMATVSNRYHIASRGVSGHVNAAGWTDYTCTNSFGSQPMTEKSWQGIPNMVTYNRGHRNNYRAWYCHHFHNVRGEGRTQVETAMAFYQKHKVWLPTFVEAIKYGQERDSATLKTLQNGKNEIVLSLIDHMDDSIYDYPLTLRVHVADDWKAATVTQNGKAQELKVIDINGKKTLMFDAVPDRGNITITRAN